MTLDRLLRRPVRSLFAWVMRTLCLLMLGLACAGMAQAQPVISQIPDSPDPVPAGGIVTYTVSVGSLQGAALDNVTLLFKVASGARWAGTGTLPSGVSCSGMALEQNGPGTVTCTGIRIAAGLGAQSTLPMYVRPMTLPNTTVQASITDSATGNVSALSQTTTVNQGADLSLSVTAPAQAASARPGESVTFTVTNLGPHASPASTLTYNVPPGFSMDSGSLPAGCAMLGASVLSCTRTSALAVNASYSIKVVGTYTAGSGSELSHLASVTAGGGVDDGQTENNTNSAKVKITPGTATRLAKRQFLPSGQEFSTPLSLNQDFVYRFEPGYTGDVPLNAVLTDNLPENFCVRSAATFSSASSGWSCTTTRTCDSGGGGGVLVCRHDASRTIPALVAGNNKSMGTISLPVRAIKATGGVTNVALLDATSVSQISASVSTAVLDAGADLIATKIRNDPGYGSSNVVPVGRSFSYLISANNQGPNNIPAAGTTITLTDTVPANLKITEIQRPSASALGGGTASCNASPTPIAPLVGPATLICTLTNVAVAKGQGVPGFTLLATATAAMPALTNHVCVKLSSTEEDKLPENNCADRTLEVQAAEVDVYPVKTVKSKGDLDTNRQLAGQPIVWEIEVVNQGPGEARNVRVKDTFDNVYYSHYPQPYALTPIANAATLGSCYLDRVSGDAIKGGQLSLYCTIDKLPPCTPGTNCPKIQVSAIHFNPDTSAAPDGFTNVNRRVDTDVLDAYDAKLSNNAALNVSAYLQSRVDLNVSKTFLPAKIPVGQVLTYTIHVTNPYRSPSNARNVKVTDRLPLDVVLLSTPVANGATCSAPRPGTVITASNRALECTWPVIARDNVEQTIEVKVRPLASLLGKTLTNTVTVTSDTPEINPADNTSTVTTEVLPPDYDIIVNKTVVADPVASGTDIIYTLTVFNNRASAAENIVLEDTLPKDAGAPTYVGMVTPLPAGVDCPPSRSTAQAGKAGGVVTCTIKLLGGKRGLNGSTGESDTVSFQLRLRAAGVGSFDNNAKVYLESPALEAFNARSNPTDKVVSHVWLKTDVTVVDKYAVSRGGTDRLTAVTPQQAFDWLVLLRNKGPQDAATVEFRDALPTGMELAGPPVFTVTAKKDAFSPAAPSCSGRAGETAVACDIARMPADGEATVRIPVRWRTPLPVAGAVVENTATLVSQGSSDTDGGSDPTKGNNFFKGSVTVLTSEISGFVYHDLDGSGTRQANEPGIVTTLTLQGKDTNNNNVSKTTKSSAADGSWSFLVPPGTYTVTETPPDAFLPGITKPGAIKDGTGQAGTVATPTADVISNIRLDAGASSRDNLFGEVKGAGADVQVVRKLPVAKGAPLASTTALASVAVGDGFDWLVTVSNAGGSAAQAVKVSDTLGDGMVFVGAAEVSASAGFTLSCPTPALNTLGATLSCTSDSMPAGATATVRLRVKLLNDPGKAQLENTAAISTTTPETNTTNNTGKGQVPVPARAGSVLSGYVYHDLNADGLKAGGESGPGVAAVLTLINAGTGATVATTTSDAATGFWQFVNLPAGSYTVTLTPLGGDYKPGITQAGTVGGLKSGVVPVTGAGVSVGPKGSTANLIQNIVLPAAGSSVDNLFSVVKLASLGGRVYVDVDASKSLSTGDTGLAGVTLTLSGTDFLGNAVKASGTTSAATTGDFSFTGLLPGSYKLVQTQPADYIDGAETAGSAGGSTAVNDEISAIALGSGVGATGYFFGEVKRPNADITVKVFEDPDNDGVPAANDPGIQGVKLTLIGKDVLGNEVSIKATAVDGKPGSYVFKDVPPSDATGYTLTEIQPGNYLPGKAGVNGFPGTAQSNGNLITGVLVNTGTTAVTSLGDYHFGERVTERSTLSGRVWRDSNHDRKFDPNEPVMGGWTVQLVACSDGGTGCTSSGFVVKGSATTGADGTYRMTDILPGKYQLRFLNPAGVIVGGVWPTDDIINRPGGVNEPRPGMAWITLTGPNGEASLPEEVKNQDLPLDPSGVVYDSRTANPLAGATVRLSGPNGFSPARDLLAGTDTVLTDATGMYQFFFLPSAPAGSYTLSVTPPADYRNSADFPAQEGALNMVDCTTSKGEVVDANVQPPCLVSPQSLPTLPPPRYFLTLANPGANAQGQNLGQAVVNNHIPLDPLVLNNTLIVLTKTTPKLTVKKGEPVPYTITARYTGPVALGRVTLVDTLPPGFKYLEGSLTVQTLANGPVTPARAVVQGRQLQLQDQSFAVGETKKIQMVLAVGVGVGEGEYVNSVVARRGATDVSNTATAAVRVVPDALLDCTDVIGKVYDDRNANGVQDQGEPGLPNVRIATVNGLLVNTDADGRYHIACVAVPKEGTGSNLVLKVDERTLPSGYRVTTENPASERITRGKAVKVNFGATVHRVVRLALQSAAFADGADTLKAEHEARLAQVIEALDARPSIMRVAYEAAAGEDAALGQARAAGVRQALLERWKAHCRAKGQALFNLDVEVERVPASTTPTRR